MANADIRASLKEISTSPPRSSGMVSKLLRTRRKRASAERCLRPLGATIAIATPDRKTSNHSGEARIVAWRFTKRQPGGHGDYWGLSPSGNCWHLLLLASLLANLGVQYQRRVVHTCFMPPAPPAA